MNNNCALSSNIFDNSIKIKVKSYDLKFFLQIQEDHKWILKVN